MRITSAIHPVLRLTGPDLRMRPIERPGRHTSRSVSRVPAFAVVLLSVVAAVLVPAGPATAAVPTVVTVANIQYRLDTASRTASATGYTGAGGAVQIAASVTSGGLSYAVATIGVRAFASKMLTSVVIPSSVTTISAGAFDTDSLTSVAIPSSVTTIGAGAFYNNNLTSVVIPSSVTSISENAFNHNNLTSVLIPSSVTTIGANAFYDNNLTSVVIPSLITTIGEYAFYRNKLTSVVIPSAVTTIRDFAFDANYELARVTFVGPAPSLGKSALGRVSSTVVHYTSAYATGFVSPWNGYATLGDLNAPSPTITGDSWVGGTLTAASGTWTTGTVLAYQWQAAGTNIAGATSVTFIPTSAEAGKAITVVVTGSKGGYEAASRTNSAAPVVALLFTRSPVPTIKGTATVGQTLTAMADVWAPAPTRITYQWLRGGVAITGATDATYLLVAADQGMRITVTDTAILAAYKPTSRTSSSSVPVSAGSFSTVPIPTITGVGSVGQTLTAVAGAWAPTPAGITYQWLRNGVAIPGATEVTYRLVNADAGLLIGVTSTATRAGYTTASKTSLGKGIAKLPRL